MKVESVLIVKCGSKSVTVLVKRPDKILRIKGKQIHTNQITTKCVCVCLCVHGHVHGCMSLHKHQQNVGYIDQEDSQILTVVTRLNQSEKQKRFVNGC